ncbi:MAG: hypothetical protein V3U67_04255 [Gemmatimonadota bacterium]
MSEDARPLNPASLPLPRRIDFRVALDTYVTGRLKAVPDQEKIAANPGRTQPNSVGAESGAAAKASLTPRAGVGIPGRLTFHRGAGTWRNRLTSGASQSGVDRD